MTAKAKSIGIEFAMGENHQHGPPNKTRPQKKLKMLKMINPWKKRSFCPIT